ncbi:hypothetical protein TUM4445_35820 [Shewanella sp. MBTL60-112-B2]|nr:hypothetical protein TUM4445_35820 [Shewanella sp. MBTL60-112-B2]
MIKFKFTRKIDGFANNTEIPVWVIRGIGIVSLLYSLRHVGSSFDLAAQFFFVTLICVFSIFIMSKVKVSKHLMLSIALFSFFLVCHLHNLLTDISLLMIAASVLYFFCEVVYFLFKKMARNI